MERINKGNESEKNWTEWKNNFVRRNNKEDETEERGRNKKREEINQKIIEWRKLEAEKGIKLNVYLFWLKKVFRFHTSLIFSLSLSLSLSLRERERVSFSLLLLSFLIHCIGTKDATREWNNFSLFKASHN